jgi:hypothetical protein
MMENEQRTTTDEQQKSNNEVFVVLGQSCELETMEVSSDDHEDERVYKRVAEECRSSSEVNCQWVEFRCGPSTKSTQLIYSNPRV